MQSIFFFFRKPVFYQLANTYFARQWICFLNLDFHMGSFLKGGRTHIDFHSIEGKFQGFPFSVFFLPLPILASPPQKTLNCLIYSLSSRSTKVNSVPVSIFAHAIPLAWKVLWLRSNWHVSFSSKPSLAVITTEESPQYHSFLLLCFACQLMFYALSLPVCKSHLPDCSRSSFE